MALPAKQRNKLRRTVLALKILVQVFRKGKMRKSTQNEMIYQFYHGDAAAGIPPRVRVGPPVGEPICDMDALALASNSSLNCQDKFNFLVSCAFKPDSRLMITNNFAQREVSTAVYDEEQTHLHPVDRRRPRPWRFADEFH
jgi:hypothetical protein